MSDTILWPVDVERVAMFRVTDAAGAAVTGLTNNDFTKRSYVNQSTTGAPTVTITEVGNGNYKAAFTPDTADADFDVFIEHATYGGAGWHESLRTEAGASVQRAALAGSVTNAAPTTTTLRDSTKSATADFYNGCVVAFTSGDLKGLARKIEDYDGTNKEFTVDALPAAPAQNDTFVILGRIDD